jgi:hypothetical protein
MNMRVDAATLMETVAVFEAATDFEDAIDELMCSGFDRAELSVVASDKRVEEKLGHIYRTVAELEDDGTVPHRSSYVAPESIHEAEGALVGGPFYVSGPLPQLPSSSLTAVRWRRKSTGLSSPGRQAG